MNKVKPFAIAIGLVFILGALGRLVQNTVFAAETQGATPTALVAQAAETASEAAPAAPAQDTATAAAPTEAGPAGGIQFLEPEAALSFNYADLMNEQQIQVGVLNNSAKELSVTGEISIPGVLEFQPTYTPTSTPSPGASLTSSPEGELPATSTPTLTPTPFPKQVVLKFKGENTENVSIASGETAVMKFWLCKCPDGKCDAVNGAEVECFGHDSSEGKYPELKDGSYNGIIIVRALDGNEFINVIQRPFTLQVGSPKAPAADASKIEVISENDNVNYDLRELESGVDQISLVIKNNDSTATTLDTEVIFPDLVQQLYGTKTFELAAGDVTTITLCLKEEVPDAPSPKPDSSEDSSDLSPTAILTNTLPSEETSATLPTRSPKSSLCGETTLAVQPEPGVYAGFIILKYSDSDSTIKHIPIQLTVTSSKTGADQVIGWVQNVAQKWVGIKLGTIEWFILAALLLLIFVYGMRALWWLQGKPGFVEITLTNKTGKDDIVMDEAEKVVMQERLAKAGLLRRPTVPGGTFGESLLTVLETDQIVTTKWITSLLKIFFSRVLQKPGHLVNGTFLVREQKPTKGLIIEISDSRNGKTRMIKPFWRDTFREAVESAAYFTYYEITSQPRVRRKIEGWRLFPSPDAFEHYQRGLLFEEKGQYEEARIAYLAAAVAAPNNALIRYRFGNLMESNPDFNHYLDAAEAYLEALTIWPNLQDARYRLAATLSFSKELVKEWKEWKDQCEEKMRNFSALILKVTEKEIDLNQTDSSLTKFFLDLAHEQCDKLLGSFNYTENTKKNIVEMAKYSIDLRRSGQPVSEKVEMGKIERILSSEGTNWQVRYNAVCAYAIAMGLPLVENKAEFEKAAFEQLEIILRDPDNRLPINWLRENDPDLEELRKTPLFKALFAAEAAPAEAPDLVKVKALCHSWDVLAGAAKLQKEEWYNRMIATRGAVQLAEAELEAWRKEDDDLWQAVYQLAIGADDEAKRTRFWEGFKLVRTTAGDLPKAGLECEEKSCAKHTERWKGLSDCALSRVEQLQNENIPEMYQWEKKDWVQKQWVLWQTLFAWSSSPLDDGLFLRYKNKGGCNPANQI